MAKRLTYGIIGVIILSIGLTLLVISDLGVGPFDTLGLAVSEITGITFGDSLLLLQLIFALVLVLYVITKKTKLTILQVLSTVISILLITRLINLFGLFIDDVLINEIFTFIIGFILYTIGIWLFMKSNTIIPPADKFCVTTASFFNIKQGTTKLYLDIATTVLSLLLIFVFKLSISFTIYSLIIVFFTGPSINLYDKVFQKIGVKLD